MEIKITKKMRFEELKGILETMERQDLVDFVNHEIELIDKKAINRKAGTGKKAKENEAIAEIILEAMEKVGKPTTITDLLKVDILADYVTEDGKPLSNQKVSAILKPLLRTEENPNGTVVRTMDKKTTLFAIAE